MSVRRTTVAGALLFSLIAPASALQTRGFVQANGTKLYYQEEGGGPAVILLHGGWLNSRQWDDQMPVLSRNYRVVRYDVRGAGRSPLGDSSYAHFEDLAALLAHLKIERAHLIGLSAGSQIALEFTLNHPAAVRSLMIGASPLAGFDLGGEFTEGMRGVVSAGAAEDLELLHERVWAFAPFRVASRMPEVRRVLDEMIVHQNTWAANRATAPRPKRPPTPPAARLAEIKAPVLIVVGEGEMPAFVKEAEFVARNIAGAELVRVKGAGHFVNLEQPKKYNEIATRWLRRVDRPHS